MEIWWDCAYLVEHFAGLASDLLVGAEVVEQGHLNTFGVRMFLSGSDSSHESGSESLQTPDKSHSSDALRVGTKRVRKYDSLPRELECVPWRNYIRRALARWKSSRSW